MSATDAAIQKKMYGSGIATCISLEEYGILLKGTSKTIENENKEQRGGFLSMLLGTLGASLLGNLLTGRGLYRTGKGMYRSCNGMYRTGNGMYRTGQGLKKTN